MREICPKLKICEICKNIFLHRTALLAASSSGVFILSFEHISRIALVFLLLTLKK